MGSSPIIPIAMGLGFVALLGAVLMSGDSDEPTHGDLGDQPGTWFTWEALTASATARKHGLDNTPGPAERAALVELVANVLDPLAAYLHEAGFEVRVNSGFRAPMVNKLGGGAPSSDHQSGHAVDIVVEGLSPAQLALVLIELGLPYDQLIVYKTHLHVGYRPDWREEIKRKTDAGFESITLDELSTLAA